MEQSTVPSPAAAAPITFETHPDRYKHWKLALDGPIATLSMDVREDAGLRPDYRLKLNSYDLGVDIELADAIQRIRFEHPEVHAVVITSLKERVFCAGANIFMLGGSSHGFKVNFCKFTNETRLAIEDASENSGIKFLAAVNGICAGGGYELALACDEIVLVDDGNSAVSLPETPLLGVLPGTGGLTRIVDKRKVRRDIADFFRTVAEGVKGKRAVEWRFVDAVHPTSRFKDEIARRAKELAARSDRPSAGPGIVLGPFESERDRHCAVVPMRDGRDRSRQTAGGAHGEGPRRSTACHTRRPSSPPATSSGRCASSASWTTRCCGCDSTNRRSARSSCVRSAMPTRCSRSIGRWMPIAVIGPSARSCSSSSGR